MFTMALPFIQIGQKCCCYKDYFKLDKYEHELSRVMNFSQTVIRAI